MHYYVKTKPPGKSSEEQRWSQERLKAHYALSQKMRRLSRYNTIEEIQDVEDKAFWEVITAVREGDIPAAMRWIEQLFPGESMDFHDAFCENLEDEEESLRISIVEYAREALAPLINSVDQQTQQAEEAYDRGEEFDLFSDDTRVNQLISIFQLVDDGDRAMAYSYLIELFPGENELFYEYCLDRYLLTMENIIAVWTDEISRYEQAVAEVLNQWIEVHYMYQNISPEHAQPIMSEFLNVDRMVKKLSAEFQLARYNSAVRGKTDEESKELRFIHFVDEYWLRKHHFWSDVDRVQEAVKRIEEKITATR